MGPSGKEVRGSGVVGSTSTRVTVRLRYRIYVLGYVGVVLVLTWLGVAVDAVPGGVVFAGVFVASGLFGTACSKLSCQACRDRACYEWNPSWSWSGEPHTIPLLPRACRSCGAIL